MDSFLKSVAVEWLERRQLEADWSPLGRSAYLWLGSSLLRSGTLLTGSTLLLKLLWVLNLRVVIGFGPNSTWFKPKPHLGELDLVLKPCSTKFHGETSQG